MLLVDIGNTNLRWARYQHGILDAPQSVRHDGAAPVDLIAAWEGLEPAPERLLMGSVGGPEVAEAISRVVSALWGIRAEIIRVRPVALGVRVAYGEPERLGVDRWLALIGARHRPGGPKLIVDAGTAVTYDLMHADGRHLGGLILPGVAMMRTALLGNTRIPPSPGAGEVAEGGDPWAVETEGAIRKGSLNACASLAERLYDRLAETAEGAVPELLLTGGDGARLAPLIARPAEQVPDLTLLGLARLADQGVGP